MNFDPSKEIVLENDKVRLRPLQMDDFANLLPFSIYEPELWTYSLIPANGEANLKNYIEVALKHRADGTAYPFVVIDKGSGKIAGSTRYYDVQPYHNTVQLGYTWYGKEFQGTGLNKNCKLILLNYAFDTMNVERVEFRADAKNTRSIAAMKSIGCTEEGILRSNCTSPYGRRDSIVLSILKSEWYGGIREALVMKID